MKFRLFYRGYLKSDGSIKDKQLLRRNFHKQLSTLWSQKPLKGISRGFSTDLNGQLPKPRDTNLINKVGPFSFLPLVCQKLSSVADLDITFLRPEEPGSIVTKGGDIDNRIKTLLDGLRMPKSANEIPSDDNPHDGEDPFFCLLEDDSLVTHLSVTTDRLLEFNNPNEVVLLINVTVRVTETSLKNIILIG